MGTGRAGAILGTMSAAPIRVIAVDDHPLIRAGLDAVISAESDIQLVGEAANGAEALERYRELKPDVVLMDLRMPVMDGVAAIKALVGEFPDARVIALTTYEGDEDIYRALSAGAKGYVVKDMLRTELLTAIRQVSGGQRGIPTQVASRLAEFMPRTQLTPRELEVLTLLSKGLSNREIAAVLRREESTVKVHVKSILAKLDVDDRTEAVVVAIQRGFLHVE
jgi:two-component system, NarL family, response regulator